MNDDRAAAPTEDELVRLENAAQRWETLGTQLEAATRAARIRGRLLIAVLTAFVVAIAAFGWSIAAIHDNQIGNCHSSNGTRAGEQSLFDYFVNTQVKPPAGATAKQIAATAATAQALRDKSASVLRARNCNAAYQLLP